MHYKLSTAIATILLSTASMANAGGPPAITDFVADNTFADYWTIFGIVEDEDPGSCTLTFGGVFAGHSTTPDPDGYFEYTLWLNNGESGFVSGVATDSEGLESAEAQDYISQF